jgi:ribosome-binding protein aMBF1 (putative translation factor)
MVGMKYEPIEHKQVEFVEKAMGRPGFKEAYEERKEIYALIREMLVARENAGLTQEELAEKMGTTKSAISRLEASGKHVPSLSTLKKYAQAVGCQLVIKLIPEPKSKKRHA